MRKNKIFRALVSVLLMMSIVVSSMLTIFAESDTEASESENDGSTIDIVMLINDVAPGKKIKSTDVEVKTFKNVNIPPNVISDITKVKGKYAKMQLYAGEYVYAEQLSDKSVAASNSQLLNQAVSRSEADFLNVTDYVNADTGEDITTILQKIIDTNTKRTIYFPDGEYIISRPLTTNGAAASTVSLWLSDGAVIKAHPEKWRAVDNLRAMICLGAQDAFQTGANDVVSAGSYYSLQGGTLDCSGVAEGISIDGGRESLVKNIVIKNVSSRGIHIKKGANSDPTRDTGSSDQDLHYVTIICDGSPGSIGLHIDKGLDNHFSNFRIYDAHIGVKIETQGNSMKNIRVSYTHSEKLNELDKIYGQTIGIQDLSGSNFFYHCTAENYATAFSLNPYISVLDSCTARWTSEEGGTQTAFAFLHAMNVCPSAFRAEFFGNAPTTTFFTGSGNGKFECPIMNVGLCDNKPSSSYLRDAILPY